MTLSSQDLPREHVKYYKQSGAGIPKSAVLADGRLLTKQDKKGIFKLMSKEKGEKAMLIQINYPDNRFDYVKDNILDTLIETKKIARFRRTTGWVTLGRDPVRNARRTKITGTPTESGKLAA